MTAVRVASLADIVPGRPVSLEIDGEPIVLARVEDRVYACGGVCPHRGGPLGEGRLSGARLTCPHHGWMFDVRTGQCTFPGRGASVPSYLVTIEDEAVFVEFASRADTAVDTGERQR